MKTEIFSKAISNRNRMQILYEFEENLFEPYYLSLDNRGRKVVFGRLNNSQEVQMIEYDKILNIKVLDFSHFSPIIPILNWVFMVHLTEKDRVDSLIEHFWKNGFLTLSRKHSKYLPNPSKIGEFEIDAVGKYNKKFIFGLTLTEDDINNPKILRKIKFLANQRNKYSTKLVALFLGVPEILIPQAKKLISALDDTTKKQIKIVSITPEENLFD